MGEPPVEVSPDPVHRSWLQPHPAPVLCISESDILRRDNRSYLCNRSKCLEDLLLHRVLQLLPCSFEFVFCFRCQNQFFLTMIRKRGTVTNQLSLSSFSKIACGYNFDYTWALFPNIQWGFTWVFTTPGSTNSSVMFPAANAWAPKDSHLSYILCLVNLLPPSLSPPRCPQILLLGSYPSWSPST